MLKKTLIAAAIAAGLAGVAPTFAQPAQPQPAQAGPPQAGPSAVPPRAYGYQLMTPEERDAYRKQIQEAKTPAERTALRDAHRAEMQKRAEAQGLTLQGRGGQPRMYGQELMTPDERAAYIEKLRSAKTPEERLKLRDEHRAEMQKRAQEKGVTLPAPRGPGGGARGGGGARQSQLYGDELFTPAERQAFFDKMMAATTPEERRTLMLERRATAEARAKEKGITLPPPRGPGGPGTGPGAGTAPGLGPPRAQ